MERGPGGGLEERGGGGLWRRKGWETLGSQTPTKTDRVCGQTASVAWAGTAHLLERRYFVDGEAWHYRSGAVCGRSILTLSAPAGGTPASWLPGRLLAGFFPAEAWRNSGQVEHGEAVPWSNGF